MGNFGDAPMKQEGQAVAYDDYDYGWMKLPKYIVHMKAKGRWQVLKRFERYMDKFALLSEHPTERQARAILILMEK